MAWRYRWLHRIPARTGWFATALLAAAIAYRVGYFFFHFAIMRRDDILSDTLWEGWEATICMSACVSLLFLFHRFVTAAPNWLAFCNRQSFAIYVLHVPVLVGFQFALENTSLDPLSLTCASGFATIAVCLIISGLWERLTRPSPAVGKLAVQG
jgi:surface polysaccharide O-acyltransferase-like enzyme